MDEPSSSSSNTHSLLSSSSGSSLNWEYDVFLSFRGEDTRHNFTDHLYHAFIRNRINAFRDTEKLRKGKFIAPELLKAIEQSKFAVIILSTNYATSTWCLDELAHIVECNRLGGLEVIPVFHHVTPSEVRKQNGKYSDAFDKHETDFKGDITKVDGWRKALKEIAGVAGCNVPQDSGEVEVINGIVTHIKDALDGMLSDVPERGLIGMAPRIEKIESLLDHRSDDVLRIGIWGMGGIGKTTLAREVFKKIRKQFDHSCFVPHVRSQTVVELLLHLASILGVGSFNIDNVKKGIKQLKNALVKRKVLVILDEVDDPKQIECLALLGEVFWKGGSRLIIATTDMNLLRSLNVREDKIYNVETLRDEEAIQLLCQRAFGKDNPPKEFAALSKRLLPCACGLPLALKVIGSYLSKETVDTWPDILDSLNRDMYRDIFSVLQISYNGLQKRDQQIFLDIACFFNGEDHIRVKNILEGCGFDSKKGISTLIDRSLIKIEGNKLWMNDLLRFLGWHIICEQSSSPGDRSRLWIDDIAHKGGIRVLFDFEDARKVLMNNKGTRAVKGLFLSLPEKEPMVLKHDPFIKMSDLRLLKIYNVNFPYVHFRCVTGDLRLLEWHKCPLESLPSDFISANLVEIKIPSSRIKQLWNEELSLTFLILMDLSNCHNLTMTPDFSTVPNLKRLILQGCTALSTVHPTIRHLQRLVFLNLKGCTSLKSLPQCIDLSSLQSLILSGCSKLKDFPNIGEKMDTLSELYLDGTAILELPESIQHLKGLVLLNLSGCSNLLSLPRVLYSSLISLKFLYLSLCSSMDSLPEDIRYLEHLEELDACNTAIRKVPESIFLLKNLKLLCCSGLTCLELPNKFSGLRSLTTLNLGGCKLSEGAIPDDIGDLVSLQSLDLSENSFSTIPDSIYKLSQLKEISLINCNKLRALPKDGPPSLKYVSRSGCPMLKETSPESWKRPPPEKDSSIINCRKPEKQEDKIPELHKFPFGDPEKVRLDLSSQFWKKIPDLHLFPNLKELILEGCTKLSEIHPSIAHLEHLTSLNLKGCVDLQRLPSPIRLRSLENLNLSGCSKLEEFPDIKGDMNNLSQLLLDGTAIRYLELPTDHLKGLTLINLSSCRNLSTVPSIFSLKSLNLSRCSTISKFPGNMDYLEELDASETAIKGLLQSILHLEKLKVLSLCGCKGLKLPNSFSNLRCLTSLNLRRCGLAEGVVDILYGLSALQILDLSGNNLSIIPDGIGRLSSLKLLNLSENNLDKIPDEIGHLSSLQVLNLSENKFMSIPESISRLSKLTELHLFRCSKLQLLPHYLPFSLKHVHAQECPMLKSADTLTIWASGGFSFIHYRQSEQDDGHPNNFPITKYIKDRVSGKKPFEIRFPHSCYTGTEKSSSTGPSTGVPYSCSHWRNDPCMTIPLSDGNTAWMGLALFVVFDIVQKDNFNQSWEREETVCVFHTDVEHGTSLVFQNFTGFGAGSYGLCCYEPRCGKFSRLFDVPSSRLDVSVSTKRPDLKVRGCGIQLISEEEYAEFVESLATQTTKNMDTNFDRHCEYILDGRHCECILDEETTADRIEQVCTSTFNEDSFSKSDPEFNLRQLSILYEGRNGRERSFRFCFPAPVISIFTWFFHHHAGDVTWSRITENLLNDQKWMGLELYVQFSSTLTSGDRSFSFHVDFCSHDHESIVMHESLKINSCVGTSNQLVVIHVPRVHFRQHLNHCDDIGALFRTTNAEMEVQVCGSRLVFEHNLGDLIHSLYAAACSLGQPLLTQICSQAQPVDRRNADEAEKPVKCCSCRGSLFELFARSTAPVQPEQAPSIVGEQAPPSSIVRLKNHRCYFLQQQQYRGESDLTQLVPFRSVILLHSTSLLENRDRNQENSAEEDKSLVLARQHVRVMAETLLQGSHSYSWWKRCLNLLLQQSKVATLSAGGHTISAIKNFDPSSTYNVICFSNNPIPVWFKHDKSHQMSSRSKVGIELPASLHFDENWRGLAICVAFEVDEQGATTSPQPIKLLCHLRAKDNYCLNPIPMCSITEEQLKSLHLGRFIWLTYIPRILLTELNLVSDVEARIYVSGRGLRVEKCGIRLLYQHEEGSFKSTIIECWTSFFDNMSLIRQLAEADDQTDQPMLEGQIKVFDPDLVYNTILHSNKIPEWFGRHIEPHPNHWIWEFQLPPALNGTNWIGLAICASYHYRTETLLEGISYPFILKLQSKSNELSSTHQYQTNTKELFEYNGHIGRTGPVEFIWLSYIPRRWFLHQLNDESALEVSVTYVWWKPEKIYLRFVYAHEVEEFKQLCCSLVNCCPTV